MPKVLIVTGPGGAGKTTIAQMVAERCGSIYLDADSEDTEFFPDGGQWLPENSEKLKKAHEKILNKTSELIEKGHSVVVDYIIFGRYAEFFDMFRSRFGSGLLIKVLFPTEAVTVKRDKERDCWTTGEERIKAVSGELWDVKEIVGKENFIDTSNQSSEETFNKYFSNCFKAP
jgi:adenylate kinase family enzyme